MNESVRRNRSLRPRPGIGAMRFRAAAGGAVISSLSPFCHSREANWELIESRAWGDRRQVLAGAGESGKALRPLYYRLSYIIHLP
jgi:hypothetical protein